MTLNTMVKESLNLDNKYGSHGPLNNGLLSVNLYTEKNTTNFKVQAAPVYCSLTWVGEKLGTA